MPDYLHAKLIHMNELAEYEKFIEIVVVLARIKRHVLPLSIPESVPKSMISTLA